MKKVLTIVALLSLIGCSDNEDTTAIRGEVIFPEGFEKASQVKVVIAEVNSRGIGDLAESAMVAALTLDEDNQFDTILVATTDVSYYALGVAITSTDGSGALERFLTVGNGMDCVSQECNNLKPDKSYDLTVRVLE